MNVSDLEPRRHEPPAGWDATTFDAVTSALAAALVAAVRREANGDDDARAANPGAR